MYQIHYSFTLAFTSYLLLLTFARLPTLYLKFILALFFISISTNHILNIGRTGYMLYVLGIFIFFFSFKAVDGIRHI